MGNSENRVNAEHRIYLLIGDDRDAIERVIEQLYRPGVKIDVVGNADNPEKYRPMSQYKGIYFCDELEEIDDV